MCESVCECAITDGQLGLEFGPMGVKIKQKLASKSRFWCDFGAENTRKQQSPGAIHYLHCTPFPEAHNHPQNLVLPAIKRARLALSFPQILSCEVWEGVGEARVWVARR